MDVETHDTTTIYDLLEFEIAWGMGIFDEREYDPVQPLTVTVTVLLRAPVEAQIA